jgi:mono/diheme cytochrome c family protein
MNPQKRITLPLGIVIIAFALGALAFAAMDISNDAEPTRAETWLASFLLRMKLRSRRPSSTVQKSNAAEPELERAASMYQQMCSFCHGAARGRVAPFANSFSPRPPQFVIEPSHEPTWRDAYVIQHGIRWTGMPSFQALSEADAWHLALYVEGRNAPRE